MFDATSKAYATEALLLSLHQQQKWYAIRSIAAGLGPQKSALAGIIEQTALMNLAKTE